MGITLPIGPNKRCGCGCGFTGFPTRDAMWWLIKLVLAPVSTMAQQGWSSTSPFTHISGLRLKFPVATTLGSSGLFASNTTGSFLCRILRDPGSPLLIFVSKGGFRAKRLTGGSFLRKTPPGQNLRSFGSKWSYERISIADSGGIDSLSSATYLCSLCALDR